jgi:hypothetical protein
MPDISGQSPTNVCLKLTGALLRAFRILSVNSPEILGVMFHRKVWGWGGPVLLLGLEKIQKQNPAYPNSCSKINTKSACNSQPQRRPQAINPKSKFL